MPSFYFCTRHWISVAFITLSDAWVEICECTDAVQDRPKMQTPCCRHGIGTALRSHVHWDAVKMFPNLGTFHHSLFVYTCTPKM